MSAHLVRYTNYYQFGDAFLPSLTEEGSAEQWFYFRIIHQMRVRWENEKQERESKAGGSGQSSSRPRESQRKPKREVRPEAAAEEGREMTHAEKVKAAQDRFGIEPHKPPETLDKKPKGFKSTRLKRRR